VGGGLSTFYTVNTPPSPFLAAIRVFFDSLKAIFPEEVTFTFPGTGDTIEDSTGALNGTWTSTAPASVTGTATGAWAAGVGGRVIWRTAGLTRGRRVRGTTFLAPVAASQFDASGSLADGNATAWSAIAETLRAADGGSMRIWTRPQTSTSADGDSHAVILGVVPDAITWLRSRRT